tara:strand:- start:3332 stop:4381 length:1050 start_codon:yes stop_codon:yes gene_type:complete
MYSNIDLDNRNLTFTISGLKTSMVNALRRTVLNDIINIAFGYEPENTINIKRNTTSLHDEYIAHRISLIPVTIPNWMDDPTFDIDEYNFSLKVGQNTEQMKQSKGVITTNNITITREFNDTVQEIDPKLCFPVDPVCKNPILISRFPQRDSVEHELEIDFKLTKGTHSKHACFSPTVICAAYETDNSTENSTEHEFKVESIGTWSPIKLVSTGFNNLLVRCINIKNMIQNEDIGKNYKGDYKAIDYVLTKESHTMGNMLQEWIYDHEFDTNKDGKFFSHVSYIEPHPLEQAILFRVSLKNDADFPDFDSYKTECSRIMVEYIEALYSKIKSCQDEWKGITENMPQPTLS